MMIKIPGDLAALSDAGSRPIKISGFSGRCKDWVSDERLALFLEPCPLECLEDASRFERVKRKSDKGSRVYRAGFDLGMGMEDYYVKVFRDREVFDVMLRRMFSMKGLRRPWRYPRKLAIRFLSVSEARVSWVAASALHSHGIAAPEPAAYLVRRRGLLREDLYISRGVSGLAEPNARKYFKKRISDNDSRTWMIEKRLLILALGEFMRRISESGMYFPDLKLHNLLLQKDDEGFFRFFITDTGEAVFRDCDELVMLDRFNRNPDNNNIITNLDRVRFLKSYLSCRRDSRDWRELCANLKKNPPGWIG